MIGGGGGGAVFFREMGGWGCLLIVLEEVASGSQLFVYCACQHEQGCVGWGGSWGSLLWEIADWGYFFREMQGWGRFLQGNVGWGCFLQGNGGGGGGLYVGWGCFLQGNVGVGLFSSGKWEWGGGGGGGGWGAVCGAGAVFFREMGWGREGGCFLQGNGGWGCFLQGNGGGGGDVGGGAVFFREMWGWGCLLIVLEQAASGGQLFAYCACQHEQGCVCVGGGGSWDSLLCLPPLMRGGGCV